MPDHATLSFPVKGMHCGSCVGRIEKVLAGLDGVEAVRANLASQIVTVDLAA
ncbi:MAG: heavy-metal-associated domain-containing protein, partial [Pseudomonadota bacterium]